MRVNLNTPFFCYIVCDITKTLQEQAALANLQETPDREGYFGYNRNRQAYIEIVSFDKLIRDAELRNRILFDKLGINDYPAIPGGPPNPVTTPTSQLAFRKHPYDNTPLTGTF